MDFNTPFSILNLTVMPFWLLLIVVPRWPWAVRIVRSPLIALLPALIYVALIVPLVLQMGSGLFTAFGSLEGVMSLLGTPQGTTVAWAHFLAFDLLVGRWAYLDAVERKMTSLVMAPVLFFTFMLGPLGFTLYLIVRGIDALLKQRSAAVRAA